MQILILMHLLNLKPRKLSKLLVLGQKCTMDMRIVMLRNLDVERITPSCISPVLHTLQFLPLPANIYNAYQYVPQNFHTRAMRTLRVWVKYDFFSKRYRIKLSSLDILIYTMPSDSVNFFSRGVQRWWRRSVRVLRRFDLPQPPDTTMARPE